MLMPQKTFDEESTHTDEESTHTDEESTHI